MTYDVRTEAVQALVQYQPIKDLYGERVYQFGSMEENAGKRYIVVKFGRELPRRNWRSGPTDLPIEVWVHDEPGDYTVIDSTIRMIRQVYDALPNKEGFFESRYFSTSIDLEDPETGTIVKVATFSWTLN